MTSPTDAHQAVVALLHRVLLEAARQRQDDLHGLTESLQDDVVVTTGGTSRPAYGWFAEGAWRYGERRVHELFLNADRRLPHPAVSAAEDVLITLLHEGCHVWAQANGVQDVSRGGRYHNRRFAEAALPIGLEVERDAVIGHRTPRLSPWARSDYADLLAELEHGLVLAREPKLARAVGTGTDHDDPQATAAAPTSAAAGSGKYIFASCDCRDSRGRAVTIRVAMGSWRPGVICRSVCGATFGES